MVAGTARQLYRTIRLNTMEQVRGRRKKRSPPHAPANKETACEKFPSRRNQESPARAKGELAPVLECTLTLARATPKQYKDHIIQSRDTRESEDRRPYVIRENPPKGFKIFKIPMQGLVYHDSSMCHQGMDPPPTYPCPVDGSDKLIVG